ncbi:MAG: zinc-ribbon domain containing protein [Planctomycetales bacterium]|nr:zinc-ribbon domain containing protein [Planctomycetales bacterium]
MTFRDSSYADFVNHPRYGRCPRFTGLNPVENLSRGIYFGWHCRAEERISDTAIVAHADRQPSPTVPVTHYFDLKRKCRECGRNFIFFAEEQRHWYETLQFYLGADCVRCIDCRVAERETKRLRAHYEAFLQQPILSDHDALELADTAMLLIERGAFGDRCVERVRSLLNAIPAESQVRRFATFRDVDARSKARLRRSG